MSPAISERHLVLVMCDDEGMMHVSIVASLESDPTLLELLRPPCNDS
jgi:hypothetical protein